MSLDFTTPRGKDREEMGLVVISWDMMPCSVVDKYRSLSHKQLGYSGRLIQNIPTKHMCVQGQTR